MVLLLMPLVLVLLIQTVLLVSKMELPFLLLVVFSSYTKLLVLAMQMH
ncbi:hypothetical protein Barb4_02246 [Bacteroidales bacterium Barb4]|nr:hypothetical protein Barb4_02246 [Bacteroidales bacterium Barb4]